MKRTLHLYKKLQKYLVDTSTLSSVTANDTWHKRLSTSAVHYVFSIALFISQNLYAIFLRLEILL